MAGGPRRGGRTFYCNRANGCGVGFLTREKLVRHCCPGPPPPCPPSRPSEEVRTEDAGQKEDLRLHQLTVTNNNEHEKGNAGWELYCLEHGIQSDGQLPSSFRPLDFPGSWPLATGVWPGYTFPAGAKHVPRPVIFTYGHFFIEEQQDVMAESEAAKAPSRGTPDEELEVPSPNTDENANKEPVSNSACLAMDAAIQGTSGQGGVAKDIFDFAEEKNEVIDKFVPLIRVTQPYKQRSKEKVTMEDVGPEEKLEERQLAGHSPAGPGPLPAAECQPPCFSPANFSDSDDVTEQVYPDLGCSEDEEDPELETAVEDMLTDCQAPESCQTAASGPPGGGATVVRTAVLPFEEYITFFVYKLLL